MPSRAGVPIAVIAEIGSRLGIVGTVRLCAVGNGIVAAGRSIHRNSAIVIILVVVIARSVIAVALRSEGSADDTTDYGARPEAATSVVPVIATAASVVTATSHSRSAAAGSHSHRGGYAHSTATTHCGATAAPDETSATTTTASNHTGAAATTGGTMAATRIAAHSLGKAHARHGYRQNQRHHGGGTQNFQIDHHWLHSRDTA